MIGKKQASETFGLKTTTYMQQPKNNLTNLLYGTESSNWLLMSWNCLPPPHHHKTLPCGNQLQFSYPAQFI